MCDARRPARLSFARGAVGLHVQRLRLPEQPAGMVVALAGGPGQSASLFGTQFAQGLAPLLDGRQFVVFDQRGTGLSGPLDCRRPDRQMPTPAACARRLGSDRRFYATADSVRDLDAVRAALGAERVLVYGVSYGTLVAAQYARTFPDRVDRIVLDSPLPPEPDSVGRPTFAAIPRVLADLCAAGACAEITTDPNSDLDRVVARARRGLRITVPDSEGRRRRQRIEPEALYQRVLLPGDLAIELRAFLPAALAAAAAGDTDPLGRLLGLTDATGALIAAGVPDDNGDLREFSETTSLATLCLDIRFPWASEALAAARRRATRSFLRTAVSPGAFAPFTAAEARRVTELGICFGWPETSRFDALTTAPFGPGPTLILVGTADLRTPVERTQELLAQLPDGVRVIVPAGGHSLLPAAACVQEVLARFDRGEDPGDVCDANRAPLSVQPVPPRSLGALPPIGAEGRPGRTFTAVEDTINDAFAASSAIYRLEGFVPGVRRGRAGLQRTTDSLRMTFERYSLAARRLPRAARR